MEGFENISTNHSILGGSVVGFGRPFTAEVSNVACNSDPQEIALFVGVCSCFLDCGSASIEGDFGDGTAVAQTAGGFRVGRTSRIARRCHEFSPGRHDDVDMTDVGGERINGR
jgi:hypothetical protein